MNATPSNVITGLFPTQPRPASIQGAALAEWLELVLPVATGSPALRAAAQSALLRATGSLPPERLEDMANLFDHLAQSIA